MDLTLNNAVMGVELSGIRQFTYLVRDPPGACALTIGEPDLNTPDVIKEAAKAALDANDTHYPPAVGDKVKIIPPATAIPTRWRPSPNSRLRPMASTTPPVRSS